MSDVTAGVPAAPITTLDPSIDANDGIVDASVNVMDVDVPGDVPEVTDEVLEVTSDEVPEVTEVPAGNDGIVAEPNEARVPETVRTVDQTVRTWTRGSRTCCNGECGRLHRS